MTYVGERIRRHEDPDLLRGWSRFVADLAGGALAACFVRSPVAAGVIREIRPPREGLIFTGADLVGVDPIEAILHRPDYVRIPQPVLAVDRVSYAGEPLAVVLAPTRPEAEDLAEEVWVDIEATPAMVGLEEALHPEGASSRPGHPGVVVEGRIEKGEVDPAFAAAAEVVEFELRSHRQSAVPLESRGAVAVFGADGNRITLYASTQLPHLLRTAIADLIHLPESDLRVVTPAVGGGFGQKIALPPEYVVVAWLARRLRRSVAWIEDRRENFTSSFHGRDQFYRIRAAFDPEARLQAIDADLVADTGAYSNYPVTWGVEPLMALGELPGPYDFGRYRARSRGVATNTCPAAPYRGVSRPVLTLAMERLMDIAARRFGIDPVTIRARNLIASFPYTSVTGVVYDEGSYLGSLDAGVAAADLEGFRIRQAAARQAGRYLGMGLAVFSERTGYGTPTFGARGMEVTPGYETAELAMDPSGSVELRIGASPHGQGLATTLSQIVADQLGVAPEAVRVIHGDTDRTPYGWGTFASRSIVIGGGATKLAGAAVARRLAEIAGELMEASADDIVLKGGQAWVRGTDRGVPIAQLARTAYHRSHLLEGSGPGLSATASYDPAGTFSNACHVAEVEVDIETGRVTILRFVVVEDAGLLINPMIVDGQIAGGVAQGIANALLEEIVYDQSGNLLTTSLLDYLPPTASEVPEIEIHHLSTITDASLTGAKGLGEGGTIGAPAAVINAISDALEPFGIEMLEMPATPDRILTLLRAAKEGRR
jgi:carbon-monoxide dehydrogenase large subunit